MTPVPLTVIAGYLGAGKTTLINRLLAEDHGQRLLIMVNDFGAINIDAALLAAADEDTLTLTNGCVCCTMGADLFLALGDALDRRPRPDHIVIEASGIADPGKIANAAIAEPDLRYGGVFTVIDALNFFALSTDALIATQIKAQVAQADMLLVSKGSAAPLSACLTDLSRAPVLALEQMIQVAPTLLGDVDRLGHAACAPHPDYVAWSTRTDITLSRDALNAALAGRPPGVFRLKGFVAAPEGGGWVVQVVGRNVAITRSDVWRTQLVAIGLASQTDSAALDAWWNAATG